MAANTGIAAPDIRGRSPRHGEKRVLADPAATAKVWVALSVGHITRTAIALAISSLAFAAVESQFAVERAGAELFAVPAEDTLTSVPG